MPLPSEKSSWNSASQTVSDDASKDYPDAITAMMQKSDSVDTVPQFDFSKKILPKAEEAAPKFDFSKKILPVAKDEHPGERHLNPMDRGAGERMLGVGELINNTGIGKYVGLPSNEILDEATKIAQEQGKGTGITGAIGEMAGDPLSWMGGAEFKAAKTVPSLMKAGAKYGALSGATEPGAKNIKENAENALEGGAVGAVAAPAVPYAGKKIAEGAGNAGRTLYEGFKARAPEALDRVRENMTKQGDTAFKAMRQSGVRIIPEKSQQIVQTIESDLAQETGKNDSVLHKGTLKVLKDMHSASHKGFDIEDLHIYQKRLANVINKNSLAGGNREDAMKATVAKDLIDEKLGELKSTDIPHEAADAIHQLHLGKAVWSQMRSFETIADIVKKADGDPNRMKNLFEQLKNNKRRMKRLEPYREEIEAAARNSTPETMMKMLGKFGVDLGSIRAAASGSALPVATEVLSGKYGHPLTGTALTTAGTAAKYGQKLTARAKAERVLKAIESKQLPDSFSRPPTATPMQPANAALDSPIANAIGQLP